MDVTIAKGDYSHLCDCEQALLRSELGDRYFSSEGSANRAIREGLEQETFYVALLNSECIGFVWYLPKGAFHSFPYLHIIAVKDEYRGKGIGKTLLRFMEDKVFADSDKVFLVVADFNPSAKRFYENIGYQQVGEIPSLYRQGINEYLMMKYRAD